MAIVDATLYQLIPKEIRSKYARLLAKYSGVTDFGPALPDIRNLNRLQTIIYNLANTNRIISGGKSRLNDAMSGRASTMSIYGHGISSQLSLYQSNSAQTEFRRNESRKEREAIRYRNMMRRDIRSPLSVGDDDQFAFGANTGANRIGDFSYLAEQEEEDEKKKREIAKFAKKRFRQWNIRNDEKARYSAMMSRDIRSSLFVGDDDQYAFGADTGANRRGDFSYLAEQEEAQNAKQNAKRKRRLSAKAQITYDLLDGYDQELHDLTKKYAGAPNARAAAEQKIRNDALKKLPKFMAEMLKGTKISTKALMGLSRNSVISKLAAHPIAGTLAIAGVAAHWINNILDKSDKGNESVVGWQNAMNLYGKPSERFSNAAYLAGLKDPGKVSKLYGQLTMAFGNADMAMSVVGSGMKNLPPIARMAIAKQLGLDADVFAIMDIMSGRLSPDKARLTNAATNKQAVWKSLGYSSTGSLSDTMTAISSDVLFGITDKIGARTAQETISEAYSDRVNRQIESAINSYDNAQRSPMPNAGNNSSVSNSSTININGPITLPNVRDANGFVNDIENRASTRRAVLNDNEPTKR